MAYSNVYLEILNQRYASTQENMAAKLASLGQKPLEPGQVIGGDEVRCDPNCPRCGGAGFVRYDVPVGHPKFGKLEPCLNYSAKQLCTMDVSQFGMEREEMSLDWRAVRSKSGHVRLEGIKAAEAVVPAFKRGHGMIALLGTFGQGKTLVGKILIARSLAAGRRAVYANMSKILDNIRLAFDEKEHMNQEMVRRMEYWNSLDVLFIDELDKVNGTDWALDRMFQLLDQRYTLAIREKGLTVIASNKKDDELDGYLVSRLKDRRLGPVVYLDGPDARTVMPDGWRH